MNWEDECYLLSKRKFRENASIINVFTPTKGKVSGIVYGGNSRKIKNYLQISNKLFVNNIIKNDNKIGYFKTELVSPISPSYFNDKKRIASLISLCSILNSLLQEYQPNFNIYNSFESLVTNLNSKDWIFLYIFFELNLIKELGYDANLYTFKNEDDILTSIKKIEIDGFKYEVPNFLILGKIPEKIDSFIVKKALNFTRTIMINKFYLPNKMNLPKSRIIFENYFK